MAKKGMTLEEAFQYYQDTYEHTAQLFRNRGYEPKQPMITDIDTFETEITSMKNDQIRDDKKYIEEHKLNRKARAQGISHRARDLAYIGVAPYNRNSANTMIRAIRKYNKEQLDTIEQMKEETKADGTPKYTEKQIQNEMDKLIKEPTQMDIRRNWLDMQGSQWKHFLEKEWDDFKKANNMSKYSRGSAEAKALTKKFQDDIVGKYFNGSGNSK